MRSCTEKDRGRLSGSGIFLPFVVDLCSSVNPAECDQDHNGQRGETNRRDDRRPRPVWEQALNWILLVDERKDEDPDGVVGQGRRGESKKGEADEAIWPDPHPPTYKSNAPQCNAACYAFSFNYKFMSSKSKTTLFPFYMFYDL